MSSQQIAFQNSAGRPSCPEALLFFNGLAAMITSCDEISSMHTGSTPCYNVGANPSSEVAPEALAHEPAEPVTLTPQSVVSALRDARRGGAPGLSGMRAEHLKLLLPDLPAGELLAHTATQLARARVPQEVALAVAMARLTALRKPDGGVRGIATVDAFRRLVAGSLPV